jgi:hypothetical protein
VQVPGAALPDGSAHGAGQDHQTPLLHGASGVGEGDHGREAEVARLAAHRLGQRVGIELTFRYGHQQFAVGFFAWLQARQVLELLVPVGQGQFIIQVSAVADE